MIVDWDNGRRGMYRMGSDGQCDLKLALGNHSDPSGTEKSEEETECTFPFSFEGKWYDTCLDIPGGNSFCPPEAQSAKSVKTKMWRMCSSTTYSSKRPNPKSFCFTLGSKYGDQYRPCVLPFTYENKAYNACQTDLEYWRDAWCPTITDVNGKPLRWERCSRQWCPEEDSSGHICMTEDGGGPCLFPFRYNNTGRNFQHILQ